MKKYLFVIIIVLGSLITSGQTVYISTGKIQAKKADTIEIPVKVKNFKNICAVGIRFFHDSLSLKYVAISDIHKQLSSSDYAQVRGYITLGWFSASSSIIANVEDNSTLYKMKFVCLKSGDTELKFIEESSVISDCNFQSLKLEYNGGKIVIK